MKRTVTVDGYGTASAPSDSATLTLVATARSSDASQALARVGDVITRVGGLAREHGLGDADIRTSGLAISRCYDREGRPTDEWEADHRLRLRVAEVARLGALIGTLVLIGPAGSPDQADGATLSVTVEGIDLGLKDPHPLATLAREAAFSDARHKAEELAGLAGRSVGDVRSIVEGAAEGAHPVAKLAMFDAGSTPIEAGEQSVGVRLVVTFGLE